MASQVEIANLALAKLGADRITDFGDGTESANLVSLMFPNVVEETISDGAWTSATFRAELALLVDTPEFGFDFQFQLPTLPSVIRVLSINEDAPGENDFAIEGDKLLANVNGMKIKYIGLISDPQDFDIYLKRSIVARLALDLSYVITGKDGTTLRLQKEYLSTIQEGLTVNGMQGSSLRTVSNQISEIR